jgi:pyruvate, orthophosphate dikinase
MVLSGQLTERDSILRVNAEQMNYFLHPIVIEGKNIDGIILGTGLETTMGSVSGKVVFTGADALSYRAEGISTIFVCNAASTGDVESIEAANGVLIMHGGVTSAVVDMARSMDKTVITGAANCGMSVDMDQEVVYDGMENICIIKGQEITLDGPTGHILNGNVASTPTGTQSDFRTLMRWTDKYRRMPLFLGASSGNEVYRSLELRSDGVGLFGIEGLFADPVRLQSLQGYLLADSEYVLVDYSAPVITFFL